MAYRTKLCNGVEQDIKIFSSDTTITVPYGPVRVICASIKSSNLDKPNIYYYNHELGFVKILEQYDESTKKANKTYTLSKVI